MKKTTLINIAAFIIPAIIAFIAYSGFGETWERLLYAIAIGLTCEFGCKWITELLFDEEFRQTATTSEKAFGITGIITFAITYGYLHISYGEAYFKNLSSKYQTDFDWKMMKAWVVFLVAAFITDIIAHIVKYIVKISEK